MAEYPRRRSGASFLRENPQQWLPLSECTHMSFLTWFKNLNSDLNAIAAPDLAVYDPRGREYYVRLHERGCMNPGSVGPVSLPFWIGGWVNHLWRHRREWGVYLDECPSEPNIDFDHLGPRLSQTYTSPREAARARNHLAALIQQPMDGKPDLSNPGASDGKGLTASR